MICVTGTESTGKTTLARQLAAAYAAPLVPEVARDYLAGRQGYHRDDVLAIARAQLAAEARLLESAGELLVVDTDLTVIQVWWEEKYGDLDPWLRAALEQRSPRRYLLNAPDLPWAFDPLRESPLDRPRLHQRYREILEQGPFPFGEIAGSGDRRLVRARRRVQAWLGEARHR
ncbi:MAG: ATP-binding protein [Roseibium album]|uniref:ATP-binding protein n=1 Tax=Roseibium album TaxID=311410 RepID=UPI0032F04F71